jgi:hypothetical protein
MKAHAGRLAAAMLSLLALTIAPHTFEVNPLQAERARIEQHLLGAEQALVARDVSHLSPSQRAARIRNLAELRAYRQRGIFPHNHHHPVRHPTFVDEHGTRCAMAHLIERAGGGELVAAVAREANHAYVAELASNPDLLRWLDRQGLTVEEAARIQPVYEPEIHNDPLPKHVYAASTGVEVTLGLTTMGWTLSRVRSGEAGGLASVLGIAVGFTGVGLGLGGLYEDDANDRKLGAVNALVGLGSIVTASLALARPPRPAESRIASRPVRLSTMAPVLASDSQGRIKVGVRAVF